MPAHLVTKSNALINSTYRLSLHELRAILFAISLVDPREFELKEFYSFKISELASFFNLPQKSLYEEMKEAVTEKLWGREITYWDEEVQHITKIRWVDKVSYCPEGGEYRLRFNPDLKPFLLQLKGNFTTYKLKNVGSLNSVYAVRIFELCIMRLGKNNNKVTFQCEIEQLKTQFGLTNKYQRFYDFKNRVLEKSIKEINKNTEIRIKYEVVKQRKKPTDVRFFVQRKQRIPKNEKLVLDEEVRKKAYPGESWEEAKQRIGKVKNKCPDTIDMFEEI